MGPASEPIASFTSLLCGPTFLLCGCNLCTGLGAHLGFGLGIGNLRNLCGEVESFLGTGRGGSLCGASEFLLARCGSGCGNQGTGLSKAGNLVVNLGDNIGCAHAEQ